MFVSLFSNFSPCDLDVRNVMSVKTVVIKEQDLLINLKISCQKYLKYFVSNEISKGYFKNDQTFSKMFALWFMSFHLKTITYELKKNILTKWFNIVSGSYQAIYSKRDHF